MAEELIVYQFSRYKVERGEFRHFLSLYGPEQLPAGKPLRRLMNRFLFCVEGWDLDPRETHCIPEIRKFYTAFHAAWPYWLYFCNLDTDTLRAMVTCCLPEVTTLQRDGHSAVQVTCDPLDLVHFLRDDFGPMNAICERGQMREQDIEARTMKLFAYFGLPAGPKE